MVTQGVFNSSIFRFSVVGLLNSAVDFFITNLLVFLWHPTTFSTFMLISIMACAGGMFLSYFLNRHWTFQSTRSSSRTKEVALFFLFATLSLIVNTSAFLFFLKYLENSFHLNGFLAINLSKFGGIVAGSFVGFFSYCFIVFKSQKMRDFKNSFDFFNYSQSKISLGKQILVLIGLASLVRLGFYSITDAVFGDAVQYSEIASDLAKGNWSHIDRFWVSLFCYWQAIFYFLGASQIHATALATFIPGILLLIPVSWMSRTFYGSHVAWVAGILCCFHPRLVSYSTNGYAEMFYLFFLTLGIAFLTLTLLKPYCHWSPIAWGAAFGVYVCVRNEGILFFFLTLFIPLSVFIYHRYNKSETRQLSFLRQSQIIFGAIVGLALVIASYILLAEMTLGTTGMFQKTSVFQKKYSEQIDFEESVKEVYNEKGLSNSPESTKISPQTEIIQLGNRYVSMIKLSLQRLPGVILSPIFIFALMLPAFSKSHSSWGSKLPLISMLIFYPLIQVEPRHFFAILIPLTIFGSAGLYAFYRYLQNEVYLIYAQWIFYGIIVGIILLNMLTILGIGFQLQKDFIIQKNLAQWITKNVPSTEVVVGDGYGYISSTGFLSHHDTIPRPWTDDPKSIAAFLKKNNAHWLILYEPFLEKGNPEILTILDSGIPNLEKVYEITDNQGRRYQIYFLK